MDIRNFNLISMVVYISLLYFLVDPTSAYANLDSTHHQLHSRHTRSLRMNKLWTRTGYGIVFVYANTFNQYELRNIKTAAAEIRKHSCIPVVLFSQSQWNGESGRYPHYVFIEKNSAVGCGQSAVGIQGGVQFLTLSPDPRCLTVTTIMHEMIHALGAEHEQSRPDRNQYIQIHNPNIQHGYQNVFNVAYGTTAYGPYDFDSVMHYGKYAFSHSPNNLPTLSSRIPGYFVPAYENAHLSYWDKRKINVITGCQTKS